MIEVFLLLLALAWIVFASVQDIRTREVADWISFSLIIFALGFRFFYSLFQSDFSLFIQGVLGFVIFLVLGNLFYYGRFFAGGDAKLFIAMGTIISLSLDFWSNVWLYFAFIIIFLVVGALYGLVVSVYLSIKNHKLLKKELKKQFKSHDKFVLGVMFFGLGFMLFSIVDFMFLIFGIMVFLLPYFYLFGKAIDEACMVKKIPVGKLREGDWLCCDVKIGNKVIKSRWEGLSKDEIKQLRSKKKFVKIREGVAFVPVFLISLLIFGSFYFKGFSLATMYFLH